MNSRDGQLVGKSPNGWGMLHTEREFDANVGVRLKFRLVDGKAVQVRLNHTEEASNSASLAIWAMYVSRKEGGFVQGPKIEIGTWKDLLFVNEDGTGRVFLNGILVAGAADQFHEQPGAIGLGVENGTIEVEQFDAFEF